MEDDGNAGHADLRDLRLSRMPRTGENIAANGANKDGQLGEHDMNCTWPWCGWGLK